jgi:hypothetical protein
MPAALLKDDCKRELNFFLLEVEVLVDEDGELHDIVVANHLVHEIDIFGFCDELSQLLLAPFLLHIFLNDSACRPLVDDVLQFQLDVAFGKVNGAVGFLAGFNLVH